MYAKLLARQCRKIMENHGKSCFFLKIECTFPPCFLCGVQSKSARGRQAIALASKAESPRGESKKSKTKLNKRALGFDRMHRCGFCLQIFQHLHTGAVSYPVGKSIADTFSCAYAVLCKDMQSHRHLHYRYATLVQYIIVSAVFVQFPNRNPGQYQQYLQIKTHGPHYIIYIYIHIHMLQCDYCDLFCHVPSC